MMNVDNKIRDFGLHPNLEIPDLRVHHTIPPAQLHPSQAEKHFRRFFLTQLLTPFTVHIS